MSEPIYLEYPAPPVLRPFVHCAWTFSGPYDPTPQRIAPDGRPELIVHFRKSYIERGAHGDVIQPPALFAGQLTQPLTLVARSDVFVVGVRFHAHAARAFLGCAAEAATDKRLDLAARHGPAGAKLHVDMLRAPEEGRRCEQVALDYVEARLRGAEIDADVKVAVDALFAGATPAAPVNVSERHWQRRFKADVGVSPRMLQTILRFRRVFDAIERPETPDWVGVALAAGYFDQPQMARDFQRFLGCTARAWAAQRVGLAKALTERVSETYKKPGAPSG